MHEDALPLLECHSAAQLVFSLFGHRPRIVGANVEAPCDGYPLVGKNGLEIEQAMAGAVIDIDVDVVVGREHPGGAQQIFFPSLTVDVRSIQGSASPRTSCS